MASEEGNEGVMAWAATTLANHIKNVPAAIKKDLTQGSGPSITREAANDIRGSIHGVFFGQAEGLSQPGTPMNPLQGELVEQRREAKGDVEKSEPAPVSDGQRRGKTGNVYGVALDLNQA